jgi:DNA-binding MarR family transcriptional regulator
MGGMHAKAMAERAGVHATDFDALDVLDWMGPTTAGELAKLVGVTSGAITGVIDRLERDGWVRRTRDPDDRRRVVVEMTAGPPDRIARMMVVFEPLVSELGELNERFDDDQLETILEWLRGSNDAVERSTARLRAKG